MGDTIDLQRMALLLVAAADLSEGGYVLIRSADQRSLWRINVRYKETEHTVTAQIDRPRDRWPSLILALDRAVQWLAAAKRDPR